MPESAASLETALKIPHEYPKMNQNAVPTALQIKISDLDVEIRFQGLCQSVLISGLDIQPTWQDLGSRLSFKDKILFVIMYIFKYLSFVLCIIAYEPPLSRGHLDQDLPLF